MREEMMIKEEKTRLYIQAGLLLLAAVLSFTLLKSFATSRAFTADKVEYLDQKRNTIMEITAASTAASVAITVLPGDAGSPIADKLADVSTYSLIVLCAIFLEKYLLSITGIAAFQILVPTACIILLINLFLRKERWLKLGVRMVLLAAVVFTVIPVSVGVSRTIEKTYENSIQETIDSAKESTQEIQENAKDQNLLDKFLNTVGGGVSSVLKNFEGILNRFIEAIAVLIVTSAVIPILVMIFFIWLVKAILQSITDIPLDPLKKLGIYHTQE